MTALSLSERYYQQRRRVPNTLLARSLQMLKLLRCWLPTHELLVVGDNAFAALHFLDGVRQAATVSRAAITAPQSGKTSLR